MPVARTYARPWWRRVWLALVLAAASAMSMPGLAAPAAGSSATVLMYSGFDGTALDKHWEPTTAKGCTSLSNIRVGGGQLRLRIGPANGSDYCGARVRTKMLFRPPIMVEARVRPHLPYGSHMGLTLYGTKAEWPYGGEIDAGELIGRRPNVDHVRLWAQKRGVTAPDRCGLAENYENPASLHDTWHTFKLRWTGTGVTFFLDGTKVFEATYAALRDAGCTNPFADSTNPFRMFLTAAAGGKWTGSPVGQPGYPATYDVDYVRVTRL